VSGRRTATKLRPRWRPLPTRLRPPATTLAHVGSTAAGHGAWPCWRHNLRLRRVADPASGHTGIGAGADPSSRCAGDGPCGLAGRSAACGQAPADPATGTSSWQHRRAYQRRQPAIRPATSWPAQPRARRGPPR
jgi:hypothetical protein